MRNVKFLFAAGSIGLAAAVAVACSSSSNSGSPAGGNDAGDDVATTNGDGATTTDTGTATDDGGPAECLPTTTAGLCTDTSTTCCVDLVKLTAVCLAPSACPTKVQIACTTTSDCNPDGGSRLCCANTGGLDAGLPPGFDASALPADASPAQILSMFGGATFKASCASSCAADELQACTNASECANGGQCVTVAEAVANGDAGALGAAAGAGAFGMSKFCAAPGTASPEASTPADAASE